MPPANLAGAPGAFWGLHAVRIAKLGGFRSLHAVRIAKPGGFRGLHAVRVAKPGGFRGLHAVRVAKLGGFWGLHAVRVANSGELSYVACKLGRRPWRLLGLARRASSKTRVSYPMSPANLAGAPGAFRGLHAVRVVKRTKQVPRIDRSTPNEMDPDPALSFATSFFVTPIMLKDLLLQTRSFRRFYEDERLDADVLTAAIDAARLCPSARNAQPLKYRLVTERDECDRLFPTLRWAAYLKDWGGPAEGERPAAYLIQLLDTRIVRDPYCDDGIQALAILLSLAEHGLGGCIIKAFNAKQIQADFRLPDYLEVRTVLAIGRPRETVVIEPMSPDGDYRYWRDAAGVHHVPKRAVEELIWKEEL